MKSEINIFLHFFWREKTPENKGELTVFFNLKVNCAYSINGKNVKITKTVAIDVTKHPAKFGIKKLVEKKSYDSFYITWS